MELRNTSPAAFAAASVVSGPPITVQDRTLVIPDELKNIAVADDEASQAVKIIMARYLKGQDIATHDFILHTETAGHGIDDILFNGEKGNVKEVKDTTVELTWVLRPPQTSYAGILSIQVLVQGLEFKWHSYIGTMAVSAHIHGNPVVPVTPTMLEQIARETAGYKDEAKAGAVSATHSEANAAASAGTASTKAAEASTSAGAAKTSEANAAASKTAAASSAAAAKTSETNAENFALASAGSAGTASTKADEASASAGAAKASETNAAQAAKDAEAAAGTYPTIGANGNWWIYVNGVFTDTGYQAPGPKGDKGDTGDTGGKGATGDRGDTGPRGSLWYQGTAITGTSTTATIFAGSGITAALVGDMYLNTSTSYVYQCTVAGAASVAKWVYVGSIKGATGATGPKGDPPTIQNPAGTALPVRSTLQFTGNVETTDSGGKTVVNIKGSDGKVQTVAGVAPDAAGNVPLTDWDIKNANTGRVIARDIEEATSEFYIGTVYAAPSFYYKISNESSPAIEESTPLPPDFIPVVNNYFSFSWTVNTPVWIQVITVSNSKSIDWLRIMTMPTADGTYDDEVYEMGNSIEYSSTKTSSTIAISLTPNEHWIKQSDGSFTQTMHLDTAISAISEHIFVEFVAIKPAEATLDQCRTIAESLEYISEYSIDDMQNITLICYDSVPTVTLDLRINAIK